MDIPLIPAVAPGYSPPRPPFRALVKIPGDLVPRPDVARWVVALADIRGARFPAGDGRPPQIVAAIGGDAAIDAALRAAGIEPRPRGPMGREVRSEREWQIAYEALRQNVAAFRNSVREVRPPGETPPYSARIEAVVPIVGLPPANETLSLRAELIDGDAMVEVAYPGYDELFVLTNEDRSHLKQVRFGYLSPKVRVVAFPDMPPAP